MKVSVATKFAALPRRFGRKRFPLSTRIDFSGSLSASLGILMVWKVLKGTHEGCYCFKVY
ncbi:hypothetical protein AAZX31_20G061900 [Glycine max]